MALEERKKELLNAIINEYIKTAKAVGSNLIVDKYKFNLSPATIRNEMTELEQEGYLTHRYTSSGRIPTERGYQFYIQNFLEEKELNQKDKTLLKKSSQEIKEAHIALKNLAKTLASLSQEAVLIGFTPQDVYYTGLTNIFNQPEFSEIGLIHHLSAVVDHLDETMEDIFDEVGKEIQILIGKENPFGKDCSAILAKYYLSSQKEGLLGILGPMRMDYCNNQALVKYTQSLISNL